MACTCNCPGYVMLPAWAGYLIGITSPALFLSTVILAVLLYRQRYSKSDSTILGIDRHVSARKYYRQDSGPNGNRLSVTDEKAVLKSNEIREDLCSDDDDSDIYHDDANKTNERKVEQSKNVTRVPHQIAQSVFPPLNKEQMNMLLKGVLDKTASKTPSLSDLDKIVSDAKKEQEAEKAKVLQNSISVTKLNKTPPPSPVMKLPKFEANSIESMLNEEIKAKFCKGNKFKFKADDDVQNIGAKQHDDICSVLIHEEKKSQDKNKAVVQNNETGTDEPVVKKEKISKNNESDEDHDQDELYDSPPPPRPQTNLFDYTASSKFTPYRQSDLYDFPPSPRPHKDEHDSPLQNLDEFYDFPPAKDDLYDIPPPQANSNGTLKKNRIVSDGNASGYVFPVRDSDVDLESSQYTNLRTVHSPDMF